MDKRIKKLMAIAADPASTPAEVASARRLAERLAKNSPQPVPLKFVDGIARETVLTSWTKVYRIVPGGIKTTTCCCSAPGATRKECSAARGKKWPCQCFCHSVETEEQWQAKRAMRESRKAVNAR